MSTTKRCVVVEVFNVTPQQRVSERMLEEIVAVEHIIPPERWVCGTQSRFDREKVDRCSLEVLVACCRPQECQCPMAKFVVVSSF